MAEVLSQSQIDALLNSMVSGGEDAVETVQKEDRPTAIMISIVRKSLPRTD